jgi:hypothetical protein
VQSFKTINNFSCFAKCHAGNKGQRSSYSFFTSALDAVDWSVSRPGRALPPGKDPVILQIGGWVCFRAGLDTEVRGKIACTCRGSIPCRPFVQSVVRFCTVSTLKSSGGWVSLRAGLDTEARGQIVCTCRGSNPGRPVCSQNLY